MQAPRDPWSISFGRWNGIEFKLHGSFLVAILLLIVIACREVVDSGEQLAGLVFVFVGVWLASVLLHEVGHSIVQQHLGAGIDTISLTPIGGIRHETACHRLPTELIPYLAGPMVSTTLALIGYAMVKSRQEVPLAALLQPESLRWFQSVVEQEPSMFLTACKMAVCINSWIVLCNAVPAFPFDGAWVCAVLLRKSRRGWDTRRSLLWMCIVSRGMALVLAIAAIVVHQTMAAGVIPTWLILLILSASVYFSSRSEEETLLSSDDDEDLMGYDFSQGYAGLEREAVPRRQRLGLLRRWFMQLRVRHRQRRAQREAEEDRIVDSILERLHVHGLQSLTAAERNLLRRVSARYRTSKRGRGSVSQD